jgi:ribulose 1,5-bisphosphate synthetase/thiazole synthase
MKQDVIIVGAGLSDLAAEVYLYKVEKKVLILESSERRRKNKNRFNRRFPF